MRFSRVRLRRGYDMEDVDAFIEAIRETFLGVREPPLTSDEVRNQQFHATQLRPGYDEKDVDAFLDEVEGRLRIRCAECGAPAVEAAQFCVRCGAPVSAQRSAAAKSAVAGPGGPPAAAAARDAVWIPGRALARYLLLCLCCNLILFAGLLAVINAPVSIRAVEYPGLGSTMGWVISLSLSGVLLSSTFFCFLGDRGRWPRLRQVGWGLVPILSVWWLAFAPFLWLADIRRRARDWAVFAAYLAAVAMEIYFLAVAHPGSTAWTIGALMVLLVGGTAAVHTAVAFRPTAGVPTWFGAAVVRDADERRPALRLR